MQKVGFEIKKLNQAMIHLVDDHTGTLMVFIGLVTVCLMLTTDPISSIGHGSQPANPPVTIFLLERDLPKEFQRIGIVSISPSSRSAYFIDNEVKEQLIADCKRLGANGAYRIRDATYDPLVVSYLLFTYERL